MTKSGNTTSEHALTKYHAIISGAISLGVVMWNTFLPDKALDINTIMALAASILGTGWTVGQYSASRGAVKAGGN